MNKKHVRSLLGLCLSLILVIALSACGNNVSEEVSQGTERDDSEENNDGDSSQSNSDGSAQNKEEIDFPKEEITFVVPVSAGGGFDKMVRMIAPYWEEKLGEDATIVVKNLPGGQYNTGINEVWNADKDGHTVGIFPGVVSNQILSDVIYDMNEFHWIGQITESVFVQAASKESGFESMDDVVEEGHVKTGISGYTATAGIASLTMADSFGFEQEVISHEGSSEAILAAVRGDTDLVYQSYESLREHFETGDLVPLWVGSQERIDELSDVPSITELGDYPKLEAVGTLPRFVGTTPGIPSEVKEKLRRSFEDAVNDPDFKEEMNKNETPVQYLNEDETAEMVEEVLSQYKNVKSIIEEYVN